MPGVATPLSAGVWGDSVDRGVLAGAVALGAVAPRELETLGPPASRVTRHFHGRAAAKADTLALVGDRMPGTTGEEVVAALFGTVPETMAFRPSVRRYPVVAVRFPIAFATQPRRVRRLAEEYDRWWSQSVGAIPDLPRAAATPHLAAAVERLRVAVVVQSVAVMTCVQPAYEALAKAVAGSGIDGLSALSAVPGGAESAVVNDIWSASRGEITIAELIGRHGFHGPAEGELSSRVWREDDGPLRRVIGHYEELDASEAPARREAARRAERERLRAELIAATAAPVRPGLRLLLRLVEDRIPLRGVAKRSMLQALDVARCAARRIGEELLDEGVLDDPDEIFCLTLPEALGPPPPDIAEIVRRRAEQRERHSQVTIPEHWRGAPVPIELARRPAPVESARVEGEGVSAGVVTGVVRVVTDPGFAEVEPGEVLVAPTTDPGWASIMFISSALVVDIGGALSHAAVVARELGIPCVVNTGDGTRALRTGDRVRVDGGRGTVEVLEPAQA